MKIIKWTFIIALFTFTLTGCVEKDDGPHFESNDDAGKGGSLNKFAVVGDILYVLDDHFIQTYKISTGEMTFMGASNTHMEVETLFPFGNFLLIGGRSGMSIFEINDIGQPVFYSTYNHINACDPVVTDGHLAFVTLSSEFSCRSVNRLDILDITDFEFPELLISYDMFHPRGLGIDGNLLFICDSEKGLKIFDVTNPLNMQPIVTFDDFFAVDVIPHNGNLLVVASDALYQFDYTNVSDIHQVSSLELD